MNETEAIDRVKASRVAHLATTRPDGAPHVVPVTFALLGRNVVTAIDHKPKSTRRLQRLVNIESDPRVALLADDYREDWTRLWWVRIDGAASVVSDHSQGLTALIEKYEPYEITPPEGPFITIGIERISWWASTP